MTQTKFTPGPWTAETTTDSGSWISGSSGEWVAFSCGNTDERAKANTHLIAAAPDMYAVLEQAERFVAYFAGEAENSFVGPGTPKTCLAAIRAVRAKARGEPDATKEDRG